MKANDPVRVQLAVAGGTTWFQGRITASYPSTYDFSRRYDVVLRDGRILRRVSEKSLREIRRAA